jgi:hypothetical protein
MQDVRVVLETCRYSLIAAEQKINDLENVIRLKNEIIQINREKIDLLVEHIKRTTGEDFKLPIKVIKNGC